MRGLRLGLGLGKGKAGEPPAFTVSLTGLTSGEARNGATIGVNIVGLVGGETVTYQWTQNGTNIGGATSSTFVPNIGTNITDNNTLRCVATIDGTPYTSNGAPARYAPGTFGALSNQSFTENTGNQTYVFGAATGTGLTWTYALTSPPAGVTIVSATRTITFDTDALAIQAGTVITVTAVDQYGRAGTGSPRTFTLAITEDISVDPVISSDSFAASGSGNRATWTVEGSYAGADTLVLEGVTGTDPITVSAAQLTAQSGGSNTLEFFSIDPFTFSSTNELTGLTSTSESATRIAYQVREKNNGGTTGVLTPADVISGLDYTVPAWGSGITAASSVDGLSIVLTSSEALFLSNDFADWTVAGAASTPSVNAISGSGTTSITLTLSAAIANGETITLDFADTDTDLRDAAGNPIGDIGSPISVTNNVPASGFTPLLLDTGNNDGNSGSLTISAMDTSAQVGTNRVVAIIGFQRPGGGASQFSGVTLGGNAMTFHSRKSAAADNAQGMEVWYLDGVDVGATADLVVTGDGGNIFAVGAALYDADGSTTIATQGATGTNNASPASVNQNVAAGDGVILAAAAGGGVTYTLTGATEEAEFWRTPGFSTRTFCVGSDGDVSAATPRTFTATPSSNHANAAIMSVVLS